MVEVKQIAARSGKTLTLVIEDALREMLARQQKKGKGAPVKLTTVSGGGLQPSIDLDHSAALLALMKESGDPT